MISVEPPNAVSAAVVVAESVKSLPCSVSGPTLLNSNEKNGAESTANFQLMASAPPATFASSFLPNSANSGTAHASLFDGNSALQQQQSGVYAIGTRVQQPVWGHHEAANTKFNAAGFHNTSTTATSIGQQLVVGCTAAPVPGATTTTAADDLPPSSDPQQSSRAVLFCSAPNRSIMEGSATVMVPNSDHMAQSSSSASNFLMNASSSAAMPNSNKMDGMRHEDNKNWQPRSSTAEMLSTNSSIHPTTTPKKLKSSDENKANTKPANSDRPFPCSACGKTFGSNRNLQRHVCKVKKKSALNLPKEEQSGTKNDSQNTSETKPMSLVNIINVTAAPTQSATSNGSSQAILPTMMPNSSKEPSISSTSQPATNNNASFQCEACERVLSSSRSLRRHRSACKSVAQNTALSKSNDSIVKEEDGEGDARHPKEGKNGSSTNETSSKVADLVDSVVEKLRQQQNTAKTTTDAQVVSSLLNQAIAPQQQTYASVNSLHPAAAVSHQLHQQPSSTTIQHVQMVPNGAQPSSHHHSQFHYVQQATTPQGSSAAVISPHSSGSSHPPPPPTYATYYHHQPAPGYSAAPYQLPHQMPPPPHQTLNSPPPTIHHQWNPVPPQPAAHGPSLFGSSTTHLSSPAFPQQQLQQPHPVACGPPPTSNNIHQQEHLQKSTTIPAPLQKNATLPPISSKNVYRHLCPECDKPYSCRKNVKRHRVTVHKVPFEEAQNGPIKKIKISETPKETTFDSSQTTKDNNETSGGEAKQPTAEPRWELPKQPIISNKPPAYASPSPMQNALPPPAAPYGSANMNAAPQQAPFSAPPTLNNSPGSRRQSTLAFSFGESQPNVGGGRDNVWHYPPPPSNNWNSSQGLASGRNNASTLHYPPPPRWNNAYETNQYPPSHHQPQTAYGMGSSPSSAQYHHQQQPQQQFNYRHLSMDESRSYSTQGFVSPSYGYPPDGAFQSSNQHNLADLDYWDQIKSNVDTPLTSRSRDDDLEMARIVEDLKRSAEGDSKFASSHHQQPVNQVLSQPSIGTPTFHQLQNSKSSTADRSGGWTLSAIGDGIPHQMMTENGGPRRPIGELVLAEADTTFWEEDADKAAIRQEAIKNNSPPVLTSLKPVVVRHLENSVVNLDTLSVVNKASPATANQQTLPVNASISDGTSVSKSINNPTAAKQKKRSNIKGAKPADGLLFHCEGCNRGLSSDYSLKRHRQSCQKYKEKIVKSATNGQSNGDSQNAALQNNDSLSSIGLIEPPDSTTLWQHNQSKSVGGSPKALTNGAEEVNSRPKSAISLHHQQQSSL